MTITDTNNVVPFKKNNILLEVIYRFGNGVFLIRCPFCESKKSKCFADKVSSQFFCFSCGEYSKFICD